MTEVRSKDLYGGRYRVFSDGRLMNVGTNTFLGTEKRDTVQVKLYSSPGVPITAQLKKIVYEAFVNPIDKRCVIAHRNGDWRDCSAGNLYIKGTVDTQVMEASRSKYPSPEYAFGPPPFTRYVAKRTGEVWNAMTGDELEGSESNQGAITIRLMNDDPGLEGKTTAKTRFVYGCFNHDFDMSDSQKQVYRTADSDINDRDISCFTVGTAADMLKAARSRDPTIAQRGGQTKARPVEVMDEQNVVVATFPGFRIASQELGIAHPILLDLIKSGIPREGRTYRRQFPEQDVPEAWYKIVDSELPSWATETIRGVAGMYVSDAGRVVSPQGFLFAGDAPKENGYRSFKYKYDTYFFHTLVCFVFNGPPPGPEYTADHYNIKRHDNRAVNLHWATKVEQGSNMKSTVKVVRTCVKTGEVTEYQSRSAAARAVGVCDATIRSACERGTATQGSTWANKVSGDAAVALSGSVTGNPGVCEPVDCDFVRHLVWRAGDNDEI
jgi:hypothetical protein